MKRKFNLKLELLLMALSKSLMDILFILIPLLIIFFIKYVYLSVSFEAFITSSKLSFAVVILVAYQLTKFVEMKIFIQGLQQNWIKEKLNLGIRCFALLLILAAINLVFVIFDELQIIPESPQRLKIFGNINLGLFIFSSIFIFILEYSIKSNLKVSKRKKCRTGAIEDFLYQSRVIKEKIISLNFEIENTELKNRAEEEKTCDFCSNKPYREDKIQELNHQLALIQENIRKAQETLNNNITLYKIIQA